MIKRQAASNFRFNALTPHKLRCRDSWDMKIGRLLHSLLPYTLTALAAILGIYSYLNILGRLVGSWTVYTYVKHSISSNIFVVNFIVIALAAVSSVLLTGAVLHVLVRFRWIVSKMGPLTFYVVVTFCLWFYLSSKTTAEYETLQSIPKFRSFIYDLVTSLPIALLPVLLVTWSTRRTIRAE